MKSLIAIVICVTLLLVIGCTKPNAPGRARLEMTFRGSENECAACSYDVCGWRGENTGGGMITNVGNAGAFDIKVWISSKCGQEWSSPELTSLMAGQSTAYRAGNVYGKITGVWVTFEQERR